MLLLPGPAFAVIPIGLAILSLEFAWAGRLLERALEQAEKAKESAKQTTRTQRIVVVIASSWRSRRRSPPRSSWEIPIVPFTYLAEQPEPAGEPAHRLRRPVEREPEVFGLGALATIARNAS